ncbi:MAG: M48 family metallopeptidase [Candidatus Omnitrophica bacterium]|nr:M48 family metallopeptidase [Candidatus Omnitrophota bacterium]
MAKRAFLSVVIVSCAVLTGCTTLYNPATGKNEFILINSKTEVALGANMVPLLTQQHPLLNEKDFQERVSRLGRRIAAASDRKDIEYKFFVLDSKELNAVTLPGGLIYVNKGLMEILSDSELAYVLAHEVGHVAARHIVKKIQSNMAYQLVLTAAFAGAGDKGAKSVENIARGVDIAYALIDLSYSRKDEFEADRLSVKYALKAGFDPCACLEALEKIRKTEGPQWKALKYFRTHPYVDERIAAIRKEIPTSVTCGSKP